MKTFQTLFFSALIASSFNLYAATTEEMKAECMTSAQEDKIPAEELNAYIQDCVDSMASTEKAPAESSN